MIVLYCCLAERVEQVADLMDAVADVAATYRPGHVSVRRDGDSGLRLAAESGEAALHARPLARSEQRELARYGRFEVAVEFTIPRLTQENVGVCWDSLVAATLRVPCTVWISEEAYRAGEFFHAAEIGRTQLRRREGHVLRAEEFRLFAHG